MGFGLLSAVCLDLECGAKPNRIAGRKCYIVQTQKTQKKTLESASRYTWRHSVTICFTFFPGPDYDLERH